ncbi:hypothetical protein [Aurantiacibacter aquimixticola]|uniref:Uncharacterized protein n=1 Tax=Aurantiacibacter aquimixticola TaxID=1958945 RepID=A0A419RSS5_9SPHN|nr:hypothetical protein [Aurantiacibacter aquimixticola]RJY08830.1 hypothetical protein D6201_05155 [Aurantiacibacter aquimixticola]
MNKLAPIAIAATLLSACATTGDFSPERVVLMDPERGAAALATCSRASPMATGGFFTPSPAEITGLESDLATLLSTSREDVGPAASFAIDPSSYRREYIGYEQNGARMIYGNFLPVGMSSDRAPTTVCDGGPAFFGVEYAVADGRVSAVRFDGSIAGRVQEDILR